tara:strand:- start:31922 stop:32404 length:483 start_codon:yes stop_codon:yes gene_type:complete
MIHSEELLSLLDQKNYNYNIFNHEPLFSVEDSKNLRGDIEGTHTKNLFLKNKKDKFFLISCEENSEINLKKISKSLGLGNISFAKEDYLLKYLGVKPGSVSPFALLNDVNNIVDFYLERKLYESDLINFHPLINSSTINIKTKLFIEFMIENNKKIRIFS